MAMNWGSFYPGPWGTDGKHAYEGGRYPELPRAGGPEASGLTTRHEYPAPWGTSGKHAMPGGEMPMHGYPDPWGSKGTHKMPDGGLGLAAHGYPGSWGETGKSPSPPGSLPAADRTYDHIGDFGFRIEISGLAAGAFAKVEGLTASVETIEYQMSDDMTVRKRPGRIKYDNVRLIKGFVGNDILFRWCDEVMRGDVPRREVSVILLADDRATELCRYNLSGVFPVKWSGFKLDGKGNGAVVEEIELAIEELKRA